MRLRHALLASGPSTGFAGARVSSTGAAYGVFAPAIGQGSAATDETWVFGLRQDGTVRSNLALASVGDADGIELRVDVFSGDSGRAAGSLGPISLAPGAWAQLDALLAPLGVTNGFVRVVRLSGRSRWVAYGVVNDGALPSSGTGDGSYVAMADH